MSMPSSPASERLDWIDLLRGVGLVFMVVDHAYDWWLVQADNLGAWGRTAEFIGTLAAPIFLLLVGVSMALATDVRRARGAPARQLVRQFVRRGLIIALWGYAVNLLVFFNGDNWRDVFAFDVLQCIGIGMVLLAPIVVCAPTVSLLLLAVILGWGGQYADHLWLPGYAGTVLNGRPEIAYYPLLPWLGYVPIGILAGRTLARWRSDVKILDRLMWGLLPMGLIGWGAPVFILPTLGYRHPHLAFMVFSLGVIAWLAAGLYAWGRVTNARWRPLFNGLGYLGRETLMLYILHHLLGFRLLYWIGWVSGRSWRGQYGALDIPEATILLAVLLCVMLVAAWAWSRWKSRLSLLPERVKWETLL